MQQIDSVADGQASLLSATATSVVVAAQCHCDAGKPKRYQSTAQVGGHEDGIRFVGSTVHKRLQDEGRGDREADALMQLSRSAAWREFVPAYGGKHVDGDGVEWLVLENLCHGMARPVVLDLKIGTSQPSARLPFLLTPPLHPY